MSFFSLNANRQQRGHRLASLLAGTAVSLAAGLALLLGWQTTVYSGSEQRGNAPDVIELFTSHGCSSCPSADKLLAEIIEQNPELVALEFHVDYWNQLVHGGDGNWVDPFSDAAYTDRQRQYNAGRLDGRPGVYTPQAIINGEFAAVGSDRRRIMAQLGQRQAPIAVDALRSASGNLLIELANPESLSSRVWLVTFDVEKTTEITAGENRNVTLNNHHIVKSLEPLQKIDTRTATLEIPLNLAQGEGCAVLVQSEPLKPILGAALCPS